MTLKDYLNETYSALAENPKVRFIGYNTAKGSRMYGSLVGVPESSCIEAPVAENLMMGMAIGMALEGYKPIVCFERHDFLLLALDALVNHADKLSYISNDQFKLPILVRCIVGSKVPLNPGVQHCNDYTTALVHMVQNTPVFVADSVQRYEDALASVGKQGSGVVIIIEYKDDYGKEFPSPDPA